MIRSFILPVERVTTSAALVAAEACLTIACGAGLWQVISRFVLADPAIWSEALVRLSLIWMAMLGFSPAIRRGALMAIDLAAGLAKGTAKKLLDGVIAISILTLCGLLGFYGISMVGRVARQEMAGLEISIAWGYAAIPVGCALAAVAALAAFLDPERAPSIPAGAQSPASSTATEIL
ncbi:TRAP transporter small permease [Labrenzia sp. PHM005]|uniref:TRAP transporter small permease n=1 Tax=Labrenzia sp. PHM005 TaxID=2590016 RepID=UPI00113FD482|nr:TRAP transporter small permease subunit [Labrenzia sp. PHM005]QDG77339.1 TRAP transporter small permease subunit [Labrenzia sp. PHM005]